MWTPIGRHHKKDENNEGLCKHVTIYFEDQSLTIKDCEDYGEYDVSTFLRTNSRLEYSIKKDKKTIISGVTSSYNIYEIDHKKETEFINPETSQKIK